VLSVPQWSEEVAEAMRCRFTSRARRPLSLLFAVWLCALILETAPHLVHHLFDENQRSTCEFLAAADAPAVVGTPAEALVGLPVRDLPIDRDVPHCPPVSIMAAEARAPPLSCLASG
jgi:hypothetical protein